MTTSIIHSLRQQIATCEAQLASLRQQLAEAEHTHYNQQLLESQRQHLRHTLAADDPLSHDMNHGIADTFCSEVYAALSPHTTAEEKLIPNAWPLEKEEYRRYGRQLIMPEIGLQGT